MCGKIKGCLLKPPFPRPAAGHWLFSVGLFSVCSLFNSHAWAAQPSPKSAVAAFCRVSNSLRQLPIASSVIQAAGALPCCVLASWALPTPSPHALFRGLTSPPLVVLEQLHLPSAWVCSTMKIFCNPALGTLQLPKSLLAQLSTVAVAGFPHIPPMLKLRKNWKVSRAGEAPVNCREAIRFYFFLKIFCKLRMGNNIMMQGVRTLYSSTKEGLKIEKLNKGIINLAGIGIILVK